MKNVIYFIAIVSLIACDNGLKEKVVAKHLTNLPKIKEYYKDIDGKEVKIKEVRFFMNGEKESEGGIKNGKKHNTWTFWYTNGEKWIEENYSEGLKNGAFTVWYENGEKNYEGEYDMGIPSGEWTFWDEKGTIVKKQQY